jgi:hypothetical protein
VIHAIELMAFGVIALKTFLAFLLFDSGRS